MCAPTMLVVSLSVQARIHLESRGRLLETDAGVVSLSKTRNFVFCLILVQPRKRPDMKKNVDWDAKHRSNNLRAPSARQTKAIRLKMSFRWWADGDPHFKLAKVVLYVYLYSRLNLNSGSLINLRVYKVSRTSYFTYPDNKVRS